MIERMVTIRASAGLFSLDRTTVTVTVLSWLNTGASQRPVAPDCGQLTQPENGHTGPPASGLVPSAGLLPPVL